MFLYVSHQEFDCNNGNYKCHYHSHDQDHHLCSCERETEFQDFQQTGSELEAIIHIFDELDGDEGILVASKIADRVGITRSVIVNALRKFESAGVIESRSSGMKGTYIKVLNEVIFDELEEIKAQRNKKS